MHPQQSWYDFQVAQELFIYEINKLTMKYGIFLVNQEPRAPVNSYSSVNLQ